MGAEIEVVAASRGDQRCRGGEWGLRVVEVVGRGLDLVRGGVVGDEHGNHPPAVSWELVVRAGGPSHGCPVHWAAQLGVGAADQEGFGRVKVAQEDGVEWRKGMVRLLVAAPYGYCEVDVGQAWRLDVRVDELQRGRKGDDVGASALHGPEAQVPQVVEDDGEGGNVSVHLLSERVAVVLTVSGN